MKKLLFLFGLLFLFTTSHLTSQTWSLVGADIDGEAAFDSSGFSVSVSADGKRVAILAPENDGGGPGYGQVRVFEESGGVWTQLGGEFNGSPTFRNLAYSLSLSGNGKRLAIHAKGDGGTTWNGYVRIYAESGGVWTQVGGTISGEGAFDSSRRLSLSYDGKRIAIGAPFNDGVNYDAGHVRVYKQSGSNWVLVGADIDPTITFPGHFGWSVSLSGDGKIVAIGSDVMGKVKVFSESGGSWTLLGGEIVGGASGQSFGRSLSLSSDGTHLAVGAWVGINGDSLHTGHVRVFSLSGGVWTQVGNIIEGEGDGDRFGYSVSLSSNGQTVAIGAYQNDGNGTDAGHARVYSNIGGIWTQLGIDIDGEEAGDQSGQSVSLSADGQRVVIGAGGNDGNGINAGHVRVYEQVPCDVDDDGYDNVACGGSDCNDNDASVNPGATDVCNGADDNCNGTVDEGTADTDGDGVCDDLDNCPATVNTNQADTDGDDVGDACDACPNDPANDADGDGICGDVDNCPSSANADQEDSDCDTVGDACDVCPGGDDSMDNNNDGIADCSQLLNYSLYSSTWYCGTNKINVCHSGVTTCISKNQLSTHYNHGDKIGPCISCGGMNISIPDYSGDVADMNEHPELEIFPNPANDHLQIHHDGEISELRLISAQGKILSPESHQDLREINLEQLPSGLYVLMIRSGDEWVMKKFIKL